METGVAFNQVIRCQSFELNLYTREVYKNGQKLTLHGQPIDVLAMLLERPGELVTREQLRKKLWPETTYVDFEHGLNSTINRLREALGDHAEHPQYIETLPRLGYRLIVLMENLPKEAPPPSPIFPKAPAPNVSINAALPAPAKAQPTEKSDIPHPTRRSRWLLAIGLSSAVALPTATHWYLRHPPPVPYITEFRQLTNDGQVKILVGADDQRLYFNQEFPFSIAQVGVTGGDIALIPVALPNPLLKSVSPDGAALLVTSMTSGGLWTVQIPGGSLRHLSNETVRCADWSPDGGSIVYSTDKGDISIMRSDGSEARRILEAQVSAPCSNEDNVVWSPDSRSIRFAADNRLWELSAEGSRKHLLLPAWRPAARQRCGRWTPDGRFFLFWSQDSSSLKSQIWAIDERRRLFHRAAAEPIQLTPGLVRWSRPIPSKDGKTIFARGTVDRGELVRYDAKSRQLQPFLGGMSATYLRFSPDGKTVAYITSPQGALWRANQDGSNPVQLTAPPLRAELPKWSPDGTQILFDATDANGQTKIYSVSSLGGAPQPFLPEQTKGLTEPNWSPDGRKIVFCKGGPADARSDIRILDVEHHKIITVPGSVGLFAPMWSPNGRSIVALDIITGAMRLFDVETERWSLLEKEVVAWPNWSRDGKFIYFFRWIKGVQVYRIRFPGGTAERVVDLPGFHGGLNSFMTLDPKDAPIFMRSTGTDEIYALTLEAK
ncbi:winged helix-turn-helix domain-containing protein [Telmatobacter sp. DSM 110680]|uniref:Winged helix-turn-helix domain-containing protein n=1 Tax=Telmatobacter sp. DSM 110680 TaxID=3036704 RepID=A0AAU7DDR0_9BACT